MNYCEENISTCKFIELNGAKLCCFTNGHIYRVMPNGDMKYCKGTILNNGYLQSSIRCKGYLHHRIICYAFKELNIENTFSYIDHINHIKHDNRFENLRIVSPQENTFNCIAKGYTWDKQTNKWRAKLSLNGKNICLGRFENEEDARNAYLKAKEQYHIIPNN